MKKSGALVALVALIIIGAAFALTRGSNSNKEVKTTLTTQTAPTAQATTGEPPAPSPPTADSSTAATVITYGDDGFSPSSATVKSGGQVTIKNISSRTLDFASNPHPVHTDNQELNVGTIAAGSSKTITVTKSGTWGFHNHLRSTDTGTLIVE